MARILVIDDDETSRLVIGTILENAGHDVSFAIDGAMGLMLYRENPYDLVTVDLVMPVKNGLQTIRELEENYHHPRVIAISGDSPEQLPMAEDYGAMAVLLKPVTESALISEVDQILERQLGWDDFHYCN